MEIATKLIADGIVVAIAVVSIYMLVFRIDRRNWYRTYCYIVMAGLSSYALAKFAALWYQPETLRPFEKLGVEAGAAYLNNPGFPSDHALFAMVLTLAVWYGTRHRVVTGVLFAMTCIMAAGRVAALVHTPLDVIGGIVIACIGALWYPPIRRKLMSITTSQKSKQMVK